MRSVLGIFACVMAIGLVACGEPKEEGITIVFDDEAEGVINNTLVHGSVDSIGLLNFLNDESTTFEVLDIDARWIADPPQALSTTEMDLMVHLVHGMTIALIAPTKWTRKWVGPKATARILTFAGDHGFIPAGDDSRRV